MSRDLRVNGEIRVREVRVISPEGEQLGILPTREALSLAQERNLDLVEVAPNAQPPVCRIMDYGKFRYEQSKRERDARKKQKAITIKELRMTPKIETHDFQIKLRNAERFLRDGDKVKITVRFRGREIVHADLARNKLLELANQLQTVSAVERPPRLEGRHMIMILAPKLQESKAQAATQPS
ncbi:MAG: translation initiation factor IF-3 [Firmicutes bacterium]|nr:translation initiation factor IF-3 [Bacillota bacterium]